MDDLSEMSVAKAWDYAIGLIKVDGLEPTEDFKKYIELEKQGKATTQDLKKYLDKKYKAKGEADLHCEYTMIHRDYWKHVIHCKDGLSR